jgi:predicted DNA-binding transcriptional regulator AlpA
MTQCAVMFSTRQAAKKLGLGLKTLSRYVEQGKVPAPTILKVGTATLHAWTEEEIEQVRKLLPKIANGRKTRYKKKQSAVGNQQSAKTKTRKTKKK